MVQCSNIRLHKRYDYGGHHGKYTQESIKEKQKQSYESEVVSK